jgi:bacillithiol system protein YtxJ
MTSSMEWTALREIDQLEEIKIQSEKTPVLIFKHSFRCNISRTALDRLERHWNKIEVGSIKPYFLDLLSYRQLSDSIARTFKVDHESPQILLIHKGKSILDLSHFEIDYLQIKAAINN